LLAVSASANQKKGSPIPAVSIRASFAAVRRHSKHYLGDRRGDFRKKSRKFITINVIRRTPRPPPYARALHVILPTSAFPSPELLIGRVAAMRDHCPLPATP
jgi:hypothetical protein